MEAFKEILKNDKQLQYIKSSINYYKSTPVPSFLITDAYSKDKVSFPSNSALLSMNANAIENINTASSSTNFKRHILTVDDINRINYEMLKNAPGNFFLDERGAEGVSEDGENKPIKRKEKPVRDDKEQEMENEINTTKNKFYKKQLYDQNDSFLNSIITHLEEASTITTTNEGKVQSKKDEINQISNEQKVEWLSEINTKLISDYKKLLSEEKKWFILKEILIDANAELDLSGDIDIDATAIEEAADCTDEKAEIVHTVDKGPKIKIRHDLQVPDVLIFKRPHNTDKLDNESSHSSPVKRSKPNLTPQN